jgi:hypothetical protein
MPNFTEASVYEANINRIATTDPVLGGDATAPANLASGQLANRTKYLKDRMDTAGLPLSKVLSSGDLNSITNSGLYYVQSGVSANKPGTTGQGWMWVVNNGSTLCSQFYLDFGANELYMRRITTGPTYNPWVRLKIDSGNDLDVEFLQNQVKSMIDGASEPAVIISGIIPFNINTGAGTLQISAGVGLIDGEFVEPLAYSGVYPVYLKPDGTYTTVQPGSGTYITFNPYSSQYYADVLRRSMSYLGEIRMTVEANDLAKFDGTGLGKWEMKGWALCNGANGTVDLRSKFIVGLHPGVADYNDIADTGGAASVVLEIENLPSTPNDTSATNNFYGLIRRSVSGENKTVSGTDTSQSGVEPDIVTTPMEFPYADANDVAHENRPPWFTVAYMQRI